MRLDVTKQLLVICLNVSILIADVLCLYEKVVKGRIAESNEFPYACSLQDERRFHICGGVVLKPETILTACHCLGIFIKGRFHAFSLKGYVVVAGSVNIMENGGGQVRDIRMVIRHGKCQNIDISWIYDYSLIRLASPFGFTARLAPVELFSTRPDEIREETERLINKRESCEAIGWGNQNVESDGVYSNTSKYLKVLKVRLLSYKDCEYKLCKESLDECKFDISERSQICAISEEYGADVCTGDSGGALICKGRLFGITSWGLACGEQPYPTVYSTIHKALEFAMPNRLNYNEKINPTKSVIITIYFVNLNSLLTLF